MPSKPSKPSKRRGDSASADSPPGKQQGAIDAASSCSSGATACAASSSCSSSAAAAYCPSGATATSVENRYEETNEDYPWVDLRHIVRIDGYRRDMKSYVRRTLDTIGWELVQPCAVTAVVVVTGCSGEVYKAWIQLPNPDGAMDFEFGNKKLPADLAEFARLGAKLHGCTLKAWLLRVRTTFSELKQRAPQHCRSVMAVVLILACFDKVITYELLMKLLDDVSTWASFNPENAHSKYSVFPPMCLAALVCVAVVSNNAILLANTLVTAATDTSVELPKMPSMLLHNMVLSKVINHDLARNVIAQLRVHKKKDPKGFAKHGFALTMLENAMPADAAS